MFERFKKYKKKKAVKDKLQSLDQEYQHELRQAAHFLYSDGYAFLTDYFEAKSEILRDGLEIRDPLSKKDQQEMVMINAELAVIRTFLADLQPMKEQLKMEEEMQRVNAGAHK